MHVNWKALDAIGLAGGILLLWDDRFIIVMNSWSGEFSVSMVVEDLVRNCKWMATSVNGPSNYQRREDMFKELNDGRGLGAQEEIGTSLDSLAKCWEGA